MTNTVIFTALCDQEKKWDLTQSYDKSPYTHRKSIIQDQHKSIIS